MRKKTLGFNVNFDNENGSFNNERYYAISYEDNKKKDDDRVTYDIYTVTGELLGKITHFRKMEFRETVELLSQSARTLHILAGLTND